MKKITAIKVLESYRVWLRFSDGVEGELDFSSKPRTGVFAFWNSYDNFRKARVGDAGELLWNDQIDFCPDSLWLQVTGQKPEALLDQNPSLSMPEISRFLGISIRMYRDEHLPPRVLGCVIEWASLHENELAQCWDAARSDQVIGKFAPLI